MCCSISRRLCLLFLLIASFQITSQLKFEYEHGQTWKIVATTDQQKEFVTKLHAEHPDVLFWSGDHVPKETNLHIFTIPLDKEESILKEIGSHGIHVEEHIEPIDYLKNGTKVLRGLTLVRIPEEFEGSPSVQAPELGPSLTKTYVTHVGKIVLYIQVTDFEFDTPVEDEMNGFIDKVDIIQQITIPNRSSATVSVTLSEAKTLVKTITISFTQSLTVGGTAGINFNIQDIGIGGSGSIDAHLELSSTQTVSVSDYDTYAISKTITIPPYTTVFSYAYVDWVQDAPFPFVATATIIPSLEPFNGTGQPPPPPKLYYCPDNEQWTKCFYGCGPNACNRACAAVNSCSCCSYTIDAQALKDPFVIRDYLIATGEKDFEVVGSANGKLQLLFKGVCTGAFGLQSYFAVEDKPEA